MKISRKYAFIAAAVLMASSIAMCGCEKENNSSSENSVIFYNSNSDSNQKPENSEAEKKTNSDASKDDASQSEETVMEYIDGNIGEAAEANGISAELKNVGFLIENSTPEHTKLLYAMFNIKNTTADDINISRIDNFTVSVDGKEPSMDSITSVRASVQASNKFGDNKSINGVIGSGNSFQGYIAFEIPDDASNIEIVYYPFRYSADKSDNTAYRYNLKISDVQPAE